jgi:hypothetical protein
MHVVAHITLAAERLKRSPGLWITLLGACAMGPAIAAFGALAPISDRQPPRLGPWILLIGLAGAVLGMSAVHGTRVLRRTSSAIPVGDLILVTTPTLALVALSLLSVQLAGLETPWLVGLAGAIHLSALATLLLPLGPMAVVAVAWLLPPLMGAAKIPLVNPFGDLSTSTLASLSFAAALFVLTTIRPHALRHTR